MMMMMTIRTTTTTTTAMMMGDDDNDDWLIDLIYDDDDDNGWHRMKMTSMQTIKVVTAMDCKYLIWWHLLQRVLTAEFIDGCKISDLEAIRNMGLALKDVSSEYSQVCLKCHFLNMKNAIAIISTQCLCRSLNLNFVFKVQWTMCGYSWTTVQEFRGRI
jgi:hypothetical protein